MSYALQSKAIGLIDMAERLETKWLLEIRKLGLSTREIEERQEKINRLKARFWSGRASE